MDWVIEFMSPNFHQALPFKYMFVAVIAALALARRRLNLIESALLTLFSYMALYSVRHVSVFAIIVAPILLRISSGHCASLPRRLSEFYHARRKLFADLDGQLVGKLWPVIGMSIALGVPLWGAFRVSFSDKIFPVAAVEFLKREKLSGNMFNNDEFGDYLIFSAWPQYKVFTDGRSDMYGEKHGSPYLKVAGLQPGWKEILNRYDISWIFLSDENYSLSGINGTARVAPYLFRPSSDRLCSKNQRTSAFDRQVSFGIGPNPIKEEGRWIDVSSRRIFTAFIRMHPDGKATTQMAYWEVTSGGLGLGLCLKRSSKHKRLPGS